MLNPPGAQKTIQSRISTDMRTQMYCWDNSFDQRLRKTIQIIHDLSWAETPALQRYTLCKFSLISAYTACTLIWLNSHYAPHSLL